MNIEELRAKKASLVESENMRVAIIWDNQMGSLAGWLVDVFDETFTMRTDAGDIVEAKPEQMIGSAMLVRNML